MGIPARFQADCEFCGMELDIRRPGIYQATSGWVKNRSGGGGHGITLPEREHRYACEPCIDLKRRGSSVQMALFG